MSSEIVNITNSNNYSITTRKRWVEIHADFNITTIINDIALVKTSKPIEFKIENDRFVVNSICLPQRDYEPKGWATLSGWGLTDYNLYNILSVPKQLQEFKCPIITNEECNRLIKETRYYNPNGSRIEFNLSFMKESQFCCYSSLSPGMAINYTYVGPAPGIQFKIFNTYILFINFYFR